VSVYVDTRWLEPDAKPRAVRRHDEDDLQRAVIQYLDWALPDEGVAYAIPNGGKRHAREAARMKGLGVKAGVPDIGICYRGRALFVELKAKRGVVSPAQRAMTRKLTYCGAAVMLCRSVDELEAQLREACVPLRGSVAA
jgi:hypothetical protein